MHRYSRSPSNGAGSRIADRPQQLVAWLIEADAAGADSALQLPAAELAHDRGPEVEVEVGVTPPPVRGRQPLGRPFAEGRLAALVGGDEVEVGYELVGEALALGAGVVDAVPGGPDEAAVLAVHGGARADEVALAGDREEDLSVRPGPGGLRVLNLLGEWAGPPLGGRDGPGLERRRSGLSRRRRGHEARLARRGARRRRRLRRRRPRGSDRVARRPASAAAVQYARTSAPRSSTRFVSIPADAAAGTISRIAATRRRERRCARSLVIDESDK